jgi:hypothetical protein
MITFQEDRSPGCGHFIPEGADRCDYCKRQRLAEKNERKRKQWEAKQ